MSNRVTISFCKSVEPETTRPFHDKRRRKLLPEPATPGKSNSKPPPQLRHREVQPSERRHGDACNQHKSVPSHLIFQGLCIGARLLRYLLLVTRAWGQTDMRRFSQKAWKTTFNQNFRSNNQALVSKQDSNRVDGLKAGRKVLKITQHFCSKDPLDTVHMRLILKGQSKRIRARIFFSHPPRFLNINAMMKPMVAVSKAFC